MTTATNARPPQQTLMHDKAAEDKAEPGEKRRSPDPELQSMAKLDRIMSELPAGTHTRVLNWLRARYTRVTPEPLPDEPAQEIPF